MLYFVTRVVTQLLHTTFHLFVCFIDFLSWWYAVCIHGTYRKNLESILESGLKRMKRLHVHFSCGLPTDGQVISGNKPAMLCFGCLWNLWCMTSPPNTPNTPPKKKSTKKQTWHNYMIEVYGTYYVLNLTRPAPSRWKDNFYFFVWFNVKVLDLIFICIS